MQDSNISLVSSLHTVSVNTRPGSLFVDVTWRIWLLQNNIFCLVKVLIYFKGLELSFYEDKRTLEVPYTVFSQAGEGIPRFIVA